MAPERKKVAVIVGATSKWQADGRNTKLVHGKSLDDSDVPVGTVQPSQSVQTVNPLHL